MSEVWLHRYVLSSRRGLNATSDRTVHEGALLRVDDGVGCLHPWVELGDASLEEQLAALGEGKVDLQVERALTCARMDARARARGKSLFEGLTIPLSHVLVESENEYDRRRTEGFSIFKIKCGRDLDVERALLERIGGGTGVALRLDFNERLEPGDFLEFWESLSAAVRETVEFVEDPCPYACEVWEDLRRRTGVRLAVDRQVCVANGGVDVLVVKPAVNRIRDVMEAVGDRTLPVVFTSYMDHPVGQMYAAFEAAMALWNSPGRVGVCGLLTHNLFEGDAFCDAVRTKGPRLKAPSGTGLGFDELIASLEWERLT